MKQHEFFDLGKLMDDIFSAAEDLTTNLAGKFPPGDSERRDYYPSYAYPPANIYITEEKMLVFEFAMAGFTQKNIDLEFKGEYMLLSATPPEENTPPQDAQFFKHRLKLKAIEEQKYYVPSDKFDHSMAIATMFDGVLRIKVPPKVNPEAQDTIKVNINNQE